MPRTTENAVAAIIEVDEDINLAPFIEVAAALVDEVCAPAGYDEARLELIERWLSAHFYAIRDPRRTQEVAGPVSESFQSKVDLGLDVTHYGQQAKLLDTKGTLLILGQPRTIPQIWWLGKERNRLGS
jgi:hypothetical protein